jgi:hypothetical protein
MALETTLDHLVIATQSLEQGRAWAEDLFGVTPVAGGRHSSMSTHNILLACENGADKCYIEMIAIDPDAPPPPHARWFGLDDPALQATLQIEPRLVHWVARTNAIVEATAASDYPLETINAFSRNQFKWRMTLAAPTDTLCLLPSLIEWETASPSTQLPPSGIALRRWSLHSPQPLQLAQHLQRLAFQSAMPLELETSEQPRLVVSLDTPMGYVI